MKTVYIYVLDTLADWELGYVTAELHSKRFFKKDASLVEIKTVGHSKEAIRTMGGISIIPDCLVEEIEINRSNMLLLIGADTWDDLQHIEIIKKATALLEVGGSIAAICGATLALANCGLLNEYAHTSNSKEFLEMFCPTYKGGNLYLDELSVTDNHLITAGSTGALMWTRQIIDSLDVFEKSTLEAWFNYFNTGNPEFFYELMQTLTSAKDN